MRLLRGGGTALSSTALALIITSPSGRGQPLQPLPDDTLVRVPSSGTFVLLEQLIPNGASGRKSPLIVKSDAPVTIHRYTKEDWFEKYPVKDGDVRVTVTSTCDTDQTTVSPKVAVVPNLGGRTTLDVSIGLGSAASAEDMPFLSSGSYDATWYHKSCGFFTLDDLGGTEAVWGVSAPKTCESASECDALRKKMDFASFRSGNFPTKGCFERDGVAYFGTGGEDEDRTQEDLPGRQVRLRCEDEKVACANEVDCARASARAGMASFQAGKFYTKGCFSKNGIGYWGRGGDVASMTTPDPLGLQQRTFCDSLGWAVCTKEAECEERRKEMGARGVYVGNYPTKGCFMKNGNVFFSAGSAEDMSAPIPDGIQERVWCRASSDPRPWAVSSALERPDSSVVVEEEKESATSAASFPRSAALGSLLKGALSVIPATASPARSRTLDVCEYNVEVLLVGCYDGEPSNIEVNAPKARVVDSVMKDMKDEPYRVYPPDEWLDYYTQEVKWSAMIEFPDEKAITLNLDDGSASVEPLSEDACVEIACGRPFVDVAGNSLLASSHSESRRNFSSSWSGGVSEEAGCGRTETSATDDATSQILGKEWIRSALGEHASVASFAAFAIALMTNHAPSRLVEDSLKAALDEVRHAKASFDIASKLAGAHVGPGPLPPSSHAFDRNLTKLAMSVAREGCVDETLSSLALAAEAELIGDALENGASGGTKYSGVANDLLVWIMGELRTISIDEINHSSLAWRTLSWVCDVDVNACDAAKQKVLNENELTKAFQRRFGNSFQGNHVLREQMVAAWRNIYTHQELLYSNSYVSNSSINDGTDEDTHNMGKASLLDSLVEAITRG